MSSEVDPAFNEALETAWKTDSCPRKPGCLRTRGLRGGRQLSSPLLGQSVADNTVWPPRYARGRWNTHDNATTQTNGFCPVVDDAFGGAPSILRAPLLGGVSTVFLKLDDGQRACF